MRETATQIQTSPPMNAGTMIRPMGNALSVVCEWAIGFEVMAHQGSSEDDFRQNSRSRIVRVREKIFGP